METIFEMVQSKNQIFGQLLNAGKEYLQAKAYS
jgi:hypothetical protein